MGVETLLIAGIAAAVIGAGVSAYGQYQSGQSQKVISDFNAQQQQKQAATQLQSMQVQAALQKQQADANLQLRTAEAQAHFNNATSIDNQALGQERADQQNLIKRRQQFAEMQATQRATIAASGVSESTGTPLDLLAETAARIQQDQGEQGYQNELQRRTLFSEAAQERLGGKLALAGATLDANSQLAAAALTNASGQAQYLAGLRQAQITKLTGSAAATAGEYQAGATLFSGISNAATAAYRYKTS